MNAIIACNEFISSLQNALDWLGINHGRGAKYKNLVCEFFLQDKRSKDHILAYNESCEIVDISQLWEHDIDQFLGLKEKIRAVCSKGPTLAEDERVDTSSNRSRNDAFVYLIAGKFLRAGLKVLAVDGVPARGIADKYDGDVTIEWSGSAIDIQCKRPQTRNGVKKRVMGAQWQLARSGRPGIIALDCSKFIRPPGTLLEANSANHALHRLDSLLESKMTQELKSYLDPSIMGFVMFARVPAMTRLGHSSILSPSGKPIEYYFRRESISAWLIMNNSESPNAEILPSIYGRLRFNK